MVFLQQNSGIFYMKNLLNKLYTFYTAHKHLIINVSMSIKAITATLSGCSYLFQHQTLAFIILIIGAVSDELIKNIKS